MTNAPEADVADLRAAFSIQRMLMTRGNGSTPPPPYGPAPFDHADRAARALAQLVVEHLHRANYRVIHAASTGA